MNLILNLSIRKAGSGETCIYYIDYFYYFLNKNFNYQTYLCDGCHDISTKATSMQNLAIIYHEGNAYRVNFVFMSKNDAFNLIKKFKYNR